jgi:sigma-B regulation protein RsbU (phosphoserine phosphatase)
MDPGDLLCVYSDGLTEAVDGADEEYGLDRLAADVRERRALPLRQLSDEVLGRVNDFAHGMPQYDDQTLLLLRRT